MMGERRVDQGALFYEFSLERHVPADHLLRAIDRFVDLADLRVRLAPFYSSMGRPSIDPELLIRMLIGYCSGIRSERRLCEEVHLKIGIDQKASTHPRNDVIDPKHQSRQWERRAAIEMLAGVASVNRASSSWNIRRHSYVRIRTVDIHRAPG